MTRSATLPGDTDQLEPDTDTKVHHPHLTNVLAGIFGSIKTFYVEISGPGTTERDRLHSEIARRTWL